MGFKPMSTSPAHNSPITSTLALNTREYLAQNLCVVAGGWTSPGRKESPNSPSSTSLGDTGTDPHVKKKRVATELQTN